MKEKLQQGLILSLADTCGTDSVLPVAQVQEEPVTSLFQEHQLNVQNSLNYLDRAEPNDGFGFLILFICATIIIYLQRNSDNIFGDVFKASFDQNQALQDARVENSQRSRNLLILQLLGFVSISIFVAAAVKSLSGDEPNLQRTFFIVIATLVGFIFARKAILWVLAEVFELRHELKFHHFNLNILQSVAGVTLLPFTLILLYSHHIPKEFTLFSGLVIGGFFYLKGIQRGVAIAMNAPSLSALHLFYYLCALEILPAFVLIRIVQDG